ncbi:hypothetical protein BDE02_05G217200 [Populus trichocarpa]|nr:hypothetical protein BDE02_05G217200 [Populus trichocarpa]
MGIPSCSWLYFLSTLPRFLFLHLLFIGITVGRTGSEAVLEGSLLLIRGAKVGLKGTYTVVLSSIVFLGNLPISVH